MRRSTIALYRDGRQPTHNFQHADGQRAHGRRSRIDCICASRRLRPRKTPNFLRFSTDGSRGGIVLVQLGKQSGRSRRRRRSNPTCGAASNELSSRGYCRDDLVVADRIPDLKAHCLPRPKAVRRRLKDVDPRLKTCVARRSRCIAMVANLLITSNMRTVSGRTEGAPALIVSVRRGGSDHGKPLISSGFLLMAQEVESS